MKRAYVTLITGGDAYVPGVEALGRSIVETGSKEPRIVLATPDVSPRAVEQLTRGGWQVRRVDPISNPRPRDELLFERFGRSYCKLRAFGIDDIDRAIFLDADTIVLRNIEDLFERKAIAAAPDFFSPERFNSGVMVIEPSPQLFKEMQIALIETSTYDGGDQGFLNNFFGDWWALPVEHRLPSGYNTHHFIFQFMVAHEILRRQFLDQVRIVHYTLQKPWMGMTLMGGSSTWWEKYYAAHPEEGHPWRRRLHQLQDWSFDKIVEALGG
jgi:hypothetical protein